MAAPAIPVTTASYAPLGHDAATGEPVEYVAAIPGARACNGLITGAAGAGATTLARRIADHLRHDGWDIRIVDATDRDAVDQALDALYEAERRQSRRQPTEPYHGVVWDGLHAFLRNPDLDAADFTERLAWSLEHGPGWGVAHLATSYSLSAVAYGTTRLRNLLADNVIALRDSSDTAINIGPAALDPAILPRGHGHALVLTADRDPQALHIHLDGCPPVDGCSTCWRAENDRLAQSERAPRVAATDAVFAEHPPTGRVARWARGMWRFLNADPADEIPTPREVAELEPVAGVLRVNVR